ncbi:MAG: hypothetical protein ACYDBQ_02925 [Thermoplasmatota archaeon]
MLASRPFASITRTDAIAFTTRLRREHSGAGAHTRLQHARRLLRSALQVRDLPYAIDSALKMNAPRPTQTGRVVTETEFHALLEAVATHAKRFPHRPHREEALALY